MGRHTYAEICPNVIDAHVDEKAFIYHPQYTQRGWVWFEGVPFGKVYGNTFIREDLVKAAGFDQNLENYEVLESVEPQSIYTLESTDGQILFSPDLVMLQEFLQVFGISGSIEAQRAVAQIL